MWRIPINRFRFCGVVRKQFSNQSLPIMTSEVKDLLFYLTGKTSPESQRVLKLQHAYGCMDDLNQKSFLVNLACSHSLTIDQSNEIISKSLLLTEKNKSIKDVNNLRNKLIPDYEHIFTNIARENGLTFLLQLRSDLLDLISNNRKTNNNDNDNLKQQQLTQNEKDTLIVMETSLRKQLSQWFSVGFLKLERITYENTGGGILEKIARYETVHKVRGLLDLKARLGPGRRCYALFHPCVPEEPLVFVHVALLPEIATSMSYIHENSGFQENDKINSQNHSQSHLAYERESKAKAAIFYSINSTQPGLRGVELGNYLIKRVAQTLRGELLQLKDFSTLSPIPGFIHWLKSQKLQTKTRQKNNIDNINQKQFNFISKENIKEFNHFYSSHIALKNDIHNQNINDMNEEEVEVELIKKIINIITNHPSIIKELSLSKEHVLSHILTQLSIHYLINEKKQNKKSLSPSSSSQVQEVEYALDPVTNFHIRNGSMIHQVNWGGDISHNGIKSSSSLMANYLYDLDEIGKNSENYETFGIIKCSNNVSKLIQ